MSLKVDFPGLAVVKGRRETRRRAQQAMLVDQRCLNSTLRAEATAAHLVRVARPATAQRARSGSATAANPPPHCPAFEVLAPRSLRPRCSFQNHAWLWSAISIISMKSNLVAQLLRRASRALRRAPRRPAGLRRPLSMNWGRRNLTLHTPRSWHRRLRSMLAS